MAELDIGDCETLDVSGARNYVFAVPAEEREDGVPHVFVWSNVGPGQPERAYHRRWLYLGQVPAAADPEAVEAVLRAYQGEILSALGAYCGTTWSGSNHVGQWARNDEHDLVLEVTQALHDVGGE